MFERVFLIAEAGSNHNGNLDTAVELVHRAKEAGADAIKFQDFTLPSLFEPQQYEETLKLKNSGWRREIERLSVKPAWHEVLARAANEANIHYFSTPFSFEAVDSLDRYVPFYKVASGDITHLLLLERIAQKGKGVFLSTGSSSIEEIERAVRLLERYTLPFICIMHCIMLYPPPDETLHLNFIGTLKKHFNHPVGFSDHTTHTEAAALAVVKGARAIEKHFTLNREQQDADHKNSLDPRCFSELVRVVRRCERMLGNPERPICEEEARERIFARRGAYAARDLKRGEVVSADGIHFLRPNVGIGAEDFARLKNRKLKADVTIGTPLTWSMFD